VRRGDIHRWRRVGGILEPIGPHARKALDAFEQGQIVSVQFVADRDPVQLRAYHAMLSRAVKASGKWPSKAALEFEISLALKAGTAVVDRDGRTNWIPASRSASAMDQETFDQFVKDTEQWLADEHGLFPEDLKRDSA